MNHSLPRRRAATCTASSTTMRGMAALTGVALSLVFCAAVQAAPSVIEGKDGWLFPGWEHSDKVDRAALVANLKLLQDAKQWLEADNIKLLVMVVPAKAAFYPQRLPAGVKVSAEVEGRYADVLEQLSKAGIITFDDRGVLRGVEQGAQTAFYRADYHWTAWSAEASAAAAAQLIAKSAPLPASGSPGNVLGEWTNDRRYGDLAENFLSPDDRKRIGRDTYTVRKTPDSGNALLESAPAQVLVVGNSFVQPYLGFPQKLSNAIGQPVSLTWNPGNISVWKTMLDAVEGQDFKRNKPKLIVWQFNEARLESSPDAADAWDPQSLMPAATWRSRMRAALAQ